MSRYAAETSVPIERSEAEIKRTLQRYGADDVVSGQSARLRQAFVQFRYKGLAVELRIALPDPDAERFHFRSDGRQRGPDQHSSLWQSECRQQWRVLLLLLKANLEAVENGLLKPEEAFLSWLLLPGGTTVGKVLEGHLKGFLESGEAPKLLTFGG